MRRIVVALSCFLVLALSSVARAATLTVAWDPVAQSDVVGYRVSYGTQPGVYDRDLDAGNATFQIVDNLPQNTTYYFVVRAYAADGRMSAPSIEVQGQTASDNPGSAVLPDAPASPAPQDFAVAPLDAQLAWAPSSNATSYSVAFGTVNPPPVVAIDQAATRYAPGNLVPGTTYFWRVVAKGPGGSTDGPVWRFTTAVNGGATAAFLRTDTATAGSWKNAYGRDGYVLDAGPTSMPGYVALSTAGVPSWT